MISPPEVSDGRGIGATGNGATGTVTCARLSERAYLTAAGLSLETPALPHNQKCRCVGLDTDDLSSAACIPQEIVNLWTVRGHNVRSPGRCDHGDYGIDNIRRTRLGEQPTRLVGTLLGHRDDVAASQQAP